VQSSAVPPSAVPSTAVPSWRNEPGDIRRNLSAIDEWAGSECLGTIVRAFGGHSGERGGADLLEWLDLFSAEHWDFRGGQERNLASSAELTPEVERLVLDCAPDLGLAGPYPLGRSEYDAILMTGGMVRAGIVKPRFGRELIDAGIAAKSIVFLGAFRPFAGDESEVAEALGVPGSDEFDAMVHGMELAFGPLGQPELTGFGGEENAGWRSVRWVADGVTLSVIAAPSSDPEHRRANTADTYRFWAEQQRGAAETCLVVTTPLYVPYQGAAAVEILGLEHRLAVETVGVSETARDLGKHSQSFLPQHHLQELRSAIRGMRSLRSRLSVAEASGR
jgi:hypothetical protein